MTVDIPAVVVESSSQHSGQTGSADGMDDDDAEGASFSSSSSRFGRGGGGGGAFLDWYASLASTGPVSEALVDMMGR
jgi:hypothetical protein